MMAVLSSCSGYPSCRWVSTILYYMRDCICVCAFCGVYELHVREVAAGDLDKYLLKKKALSFT
jgi:hypothetical protein